MASLLDAHTHLRDPLIGTPEGDHEIFLFYYLNVINQMIF